MRDVDGLHGWRLDHLAMSDELKSGLIGAILGFIVVSILVNL